MEAEEFLLVRDMLRTVGTRFRADPADIGPAARAGAREALGKLGLVELRRWSPPSATAQECALLAEEHGRQPMTTSFVGTVLLAPELLRLLAHAEPPSPAMTPTIALAADLRFPRAETTGLVAWDCDGADTALCLADDGTVTAFDLRTETLSPSAADSTRIPAPDAPPQTADLRRSVHRILPESPAEFLGRLDQAEATRWRAFALVMLTSELLGAARSLVQQSVEYARERRQYGRAIGSFQAVQHLLADATALVEACTSATRYAAWCLDDQAPAAALKAARVAKAEANTSLPEAVRIAMQVFGGIAQTWEHPAHLYLRKMLVGTLTMATTADLLAVLAEPEAAS